MANLTATKRPLPLIVFHAPPLYGLHLADFHLRWLGLLSLLLAHCKNTTSAAPVAE
jgi:hypothetical protein